MFVLLTFQWDYEDTSNLTGWNLYYSDTQGQYDTNNKIYIPKEPVNETTQEITITAQQGTKVTKYFVLTAVNDITESGYSNEVAQEFIVPLDAPFSFKLRVNITN